MPPPPAFPTTRSLLPVEVQPGSAYRFFIDGVEQDEWSGAHATSLASYDVAAGRHTFEWRYTKDGTINAGLDAVWIDDIDADGGGPS